MRISCSADQQISMFLPGTAFVRRCRRVWLRDAGFLTGTTVSDLFWLPVGL